MIKPEIINRKEEVIKSLLKRGYNIILEKVFENWRSFVKEIYTEFAEDEIAFYIKGYDEHKFGDNFTVLILSHNNGNTLHRLNNDKGDFISYQTKKEDTLRSEFGLPEKYNLKYKNIIFTYPGVHSPKDKKELIHHLNLFGFYKF